MLLYMHIISKYSCVYSHFYNHILSELVPGACDVGTTGLWDLNQSSILTIADVENEFHDPSITVHGGEQVARRSGGDHTRVCMYIYI
jgi:hypothetical protein